jgi:hypothetical protein
MSIKYFTGNRLDGHVTKASGDVKTYPTSRSGKTALTALGLAETEPVAAVDGMEPKPNVADGATAATNLTVYQRIRQKVYSKTTDGQGKSFANNAGAKPGNSNTRANKLVGKYELGKMWKYRKTLKKLFTATGTAAASSGNLGHRNMYTLKGKACATAKNNVAAGTDNPLFPLDSTK